VRAPACIPRDAGHAAHERHAPAVREATSPSSHVERQLRTCTGRLDARVAPEQTLGITRKRKRHDSRPGPAATPDGSCLTRHAAGVFLRTCGFRVCVEGSGNGHACGGSARASGAGCTASVTVSSLREPPAPIRRAKRKGLAAAPILATQRSCSHAGRDRDCRSAKSRWSDPSVSSEAARGPPPSTAVCKGLDVWHQEP
jgi:hypothetical protein